MLWYLATQLLHLDSQGSFDKPGSYIYDLMVKRGHAPDYLGQAVALMLFDSAASYRAARSAMQFQDASFQVYGAATPPPPEKVFSPTTWYVRYDQASGDFSYAQQTSSEYAANAPFFADQVNAYLQDTHNLIKHSLLFIKSIKLKIKYFVFNFSN